MSVALRLAIRVVFVTFLVVSAVGPGGAYGGRGSGAGLRVLVGIGVIAFLFARLRAIRRPGEGAAAGRSRNSVLARLHTWFQRARRRRRVRQVESAAIAAAGEDDRLAPESVRSCAEALFRLVQRAWDRGDREQLATLLGPDLLAQWDGDLTELAQGGLDKPVGVLGEVEVDYVGLTLGEEHGDGHPIVLIEATLGYAESPGGEPVEGGLDPVHHLSQYWTLGIRDGVWTVLSIEEGAEGRHHLAEPIGASADSGPVAQDRAESCGATAGSSPDAAHLPRAR